MPPQTRHLPVFCNKREGGVEEKQEEVGLEVYLGAPLALEAGGSGDGAVASAEQSTEALDLVLGVDVDAEVGGRGGAGGA